MLLEKIQKTLEAQRMLNPDDRVVVAVSGGPDSVALCHLLHRLQRHFNIELILAHVHHGLRGAEADADARFVQDFGSTLGLPVLVRRLDVRSWQQEHGGSIQMAARILRYQCLRQIMSEASAGKVAVGQNADDQAEEVLLRLFRGAGQRGLTGMPATNDQGVIRPLLECHRHQILAYLEQHTLAFRQDVSNLEPWCQRNILRLELLPRLQQQFNSNLNATLLRTTKIFQQEEDYWESLLQNWLERYAPPQDSRTFRLPIAPLLETHPAMQRRLLRRVVQKLSGDLRGFGFRHTESLIRLCQSPAANRQIHLPGLLLAEKNYDWLTVTLENREFEDFHYEVPGPGRYPLPLLNRTLEVQCLRPGEPVQFSRDPGEAVMDRDRLAYPLALRPSKPGDRFRPLGLGGSKKIKDFFMDIKMPKSQRRRVPILCSPDHIVWVVGHRLDHRVRVRPETSRILRLYYRQEQGNSPEHEL
jgi:tRNA(Ile)-lysidine synthase